jgi:hypothetical protein
MIGDVWVGNGKFVGKGKFVGDGKFVGIDTGPAWMDGMGVNVSGGLVKLGVEVIAEAILFSAKANESPPTTSTMEIRAYNRPLPSWRAACII